MNGLAIGQKQVPLFFATKTSLEVVMGMSQRAELEAICHNKSWTHHWHGNWYPVMANQESNCVPRCLAFDREIYIN